MRTSAGKYKLVSESIFFFLQLVKSKTKHHPTLTLDKYAYGEVLHIIADICLQYNLSKKLKSVKRLK